MPTPSTLSTTSLLLRFVHLETILTLSKYNCVVVELERSLNRIFGGLEHKIKLTKMRALLKIQEVPCPIIEKTSTKIQSTLSEKFLKLFNSKLLNHKANSFLAIQMRAGKNRKLRKYDLAELDPNETIDEDFSRKKHELEKLTNKYHRLIS